MGIGEGEEEVGKSGVEEIEDEVEEEDGGGGSGCVTGVWVVLGFGFGLGSVGVVSMGSMEGEGEGEGEAFDRNASLGVCLVCLVRPLWRRCLLEGLLESLPGPFFFFFRKFENELLFVRTIHFV